MATPRTRTAVTMLSWMLPLLTAGCMVRIDSCGASWHVADGHSVREFDGKLVVDGERLDFDRWVEVDLDTAGLDRLACGTSSGPIELAGGEAGTATLSVHVHSAVQDDGEVYLDHGTLAVRSQHNNVVYINGVRGSVPADLSLEVDTASGNVSLQSVAQGRSLSVDTASGSVSVKGSQPASISIDTASGESRFEQCSAESLDVDTASGDVTVNGGTWGTINVDGASADVLLGQCSTELAKLDTASGDLIISGGHCRRAEIDAASGEIELREGAVVDEQHED